MIMILTIFEATLCDFIVDCMGPGIGVLNAKFNIRDFTLENIDRDADALEFCYAIYSHSPQFIVRTKQYSTVCKMPKTQ